MEEDNEFHLKSCIKLHTALQDETKIQKYNYVTMSISGDVSPTGSNNIANRNFITSGSRHPLSSSNLFIGEHLSGSLSEIKAYTVAQSKSVFRKHTFNKGSTVGNNIDSHRKELIYHFKLNYHLNLNYRLYLQKILLNFYKIFLFLFLMKYLV